MSLERIDTEGMCTVKGKPFVQITARCAVSGKSSHEHKGQVDPAEAIQLGLRLIQAAIEAERDAGTLKFLTTEAEFDLPHAGVLIEGMRRNRQQFDIDALRG